MRRLLLLFFTLVALIGLPRLADRFRDDRAALGSRARIASRSDDAKRSAASAEIAAAEAEASGKAAPAKPFSVTLAPTRPPVEPISTAGSPATQQQLVVAIQRRLNRLGFYNGEMNGKWTKRVRAAAHEFARKSAIRVKTPKPTLELLRALETASAKAEAGSNRDAPSLNMQVAEGDLAKRKTGSTDLRDWNAQAYSSGWAGKISHGTRRPRDVKSGNLAREARTPGTKRRHLVKRKRVASLNRHSRRHRHDYASEWSR